MLRFGLIAFSAIIVSSPASAGIIGFEEGFLEGDSVNLVLQDEVSVRFSCGATALNAENCVVSEAGPSTLAFVNKKNGADTSSESRTGRFSLTDAGGLNSSTNYFLEFDTSIESLSIDLIDFRTDGGGKAGDVVTLNVYGALNDIVAATANFVIEKNWVDGIVNTLSVEFAGGFRFAEIVHSGHDVGTAIDNIEFQETYPSIRTGKQVNSVSVDVSGSLYLFALGIFLILARRYLFTSLKTRS